ncbi:16S rRNA (guanine(966)-N(2))-methyltransferase RsmD [Virgibacillus sp. W0181]|uniref:16S rRNA (guanine(966)-N(2))-methyltransferase RsmD n=1 Tax=Virgibacillus sp. W0181 TaxID=3391581 RepID=UPI003F46FD49
MKQLRIIAGNLKGRQVKPVPGKQTRPTSDKVKEAVFQIIGPFFEGGECLDLFAGSGSLGIESISRGMDKAIFIDKNPKAIHTINKNRKDLEIEQQTEVYCTDAYRALQAVAKRHITFDLILIDPPYGKFNYNHLLNKIEKLNLVAKDGVIYCEHTAREQLDTLGESFTVIKQSTYSNTIGITIYKKE